MKKSFGQHYLTDKYFLKRIVDEIDFNQNMPILEIGSGSGFLTSLLANKFKKIFAVEVEHDALKLLDKRIQDEKLSNVVVIKKSILKLDLSEIINNPFFVVGNIPYNLTSKILFMLFGEIDMPSKHLPLLKSVYLMVQKEVAERLIAKPGSKAYSPLSISIQYFTNPSILFYVPKEVFSPPPKVESSFVKFEIKEKFPEVKDMTFLKQVIRVSFQQKRKIIINSLCKLIPDKKFLEKVFHSLNIDMNIRPECLSFDEYVLISERIKDRL